MDLLTTQGRSRFIAPIRIHVRLDIEWSSLLTNDLVNKTGNPVGAHKSSDAADQYRDDSTRTGFDSEGGACASTEFGAGPSPPQPPPAWPTGLIECCSTDRSPACSRSYAVRTTPTAETTRASRLGAIMPRVLTADAGMGSSKTISWSTVSKFGALGWIARLSDDAVEILNDRFGFMDLDASALRFGDIDPKSFALKPRWPEGAFARRNKAAVGPAAYMAPHRAQWVAWRKSMPFGTK
jgi:hypothetical protein